MSIELHPTKNRKLPEGYTGPRWWNLISYPLGRKGGKVRVLYYGTQLEAMTEDLEQRRRQRKAPHAVNPQFERVIPDFVEAFRLDHLPRTVESLMLHLRHLSAFFGKMTLASITDGQIRQYKAQKLKEGLKAITINKHLNNLSSLLKWAKGESLINEALKVELFAGKLTRSPVPIMPLAEDFERIIAEVHPNIRGIIMLEFYAGLRRSEAHRLRAEEVLLDRGMLILSGKGGKQRIVPINHPALIEELCARIEEVKTGYLWLSPFTGRPYRRLDESLKSAARRAGVDVRVYHHLMRHGFGTTAIEDGVELSALSKVMGHSTTKTTEIYTHIAAKHIIEEMRKFRRTDTVSDKT